MLNESKMVVKQTLKDCSRKVGIYIGNKYIVFLLTVQFIINLYRQIC